MKKRFSRRNCLTSAERVPAPDKLDTTDRPLEETAAQVIAWINGKL